MARVGWAGPAPYVDSCIADLFATSYRSGLAEYLIMDDAHIVRSVATPPLRILIADDSDAIRRIVKGLLDGRAGEWLVCGEAGDGEETLRKASELQPNVILLDLSIPLLSGLEAARILKRDNRSCHVVLMSAQEPALLARIAAAARVPFCIAKSLLVNDLAPLLETISRQRRAGRDTASREDRS